jgi:hypothetical protein
MRLVDEALEAGNHMVAASAMRLLAPVLQSSSIACGDGGLSRLEFQIRAVKCQLDFSVQSDGKRKVEGSCAHVDVLATALKSHNMSGVYRALVGTLPAEAALYSRAWRQQDGGEAHSRLRDNWNARLFSATCETRAIAPT